MFKLPDVLLKSASFPLAVLFGPWCSHRAFPAARRVLAARGVGTQRFTAAGRVVGARRVGKERFIAAGRVIAARGVVEESA